MLARLASDVRSNVIAYLALFVALGGTSLAAANLPKHSVGTKQLKNRAVTNKKLADGAVTGSKVADNSLTGGQINAGTLGTVSSASHASNADQLGGKPPSVFQTRIGGVCAANNAIQSINSDGTVSCEPTGTGTITGVTAGTGLIGGGSSGNVTLGADEGKLQHRVGGCASGQAIRSVGQDGTPTCTTAVVP